MAKNLNTEFDKTYATRENAEKAVTRALGEGHQERYDRLTYDIWPVEVEGKIRYGIVFYGERAVQAGIHFKFNIIA